jgi:predicted RNA binding protein YcfA (HicA-like mRNA interferase family)
MKIKAIIKMLENDGWHLSRTKGSHRQFKHSSKLGLVTVAGKLNNEVAIGTQISIFKQAGWEK